MIPSISSRLDQTRHGGMDHVLASIVLCRHYLLEYRLVGTLLVPPDDSVYIHNGWRLDWDACRFRSQGKSENDRGLF
jgi:hypothetical protein